MGFISVIKIENFFTPVRAYLHAGGEYLFRDLSSIKDSTEGSAVYLDKVLKENLELFKDSYFSIGILWGDKSEKNRVADLFTYRFYGDIKKRHVWKFENPNISILRVRKNSYSTNENVIFGHAVRLLGIEENYRISKDNLESYMENPPKLENLFASKINPDGFYTLLHKFQF